MRFLFFYSKENNIYFIMYGNYEISSLVDKLDIFEIFFKIIIDNNGYIEENKYDVFENEDDVKNAIHDLINILNNEDYERELFNNSIKKINFNRYIDDIHKYFFMLDEKSIEKINNI